MAESREKQALDCAQDILHRSDELTQMAGEIGDLEAEDFSPFYSRFSARADSLAPLFDEFARLLKELPIPLSDNVQEAKAKVSQCYIKLNILQGRLRVRAEALGINPDKVEAPDIEEDEERDLELEDELEPVPEAETEEQPEELPDALPDEQEDKKKKKKKEKAQQSFAEYERRREEEARQRADAERMQEEEALRRQRIEEDEWQRQEARRLAASALYGRQVNPDQPFSEYDIRMAEQRRIDEIRMAEELAAANRQMEQELRDAYRQRQNQSGYDMANSHNDLSSFRNQSGREPESPSHPEEGNIQPGQPQQPNPQEDTRQSIATAFGFSAAYISGMSANELRFWEHRLYDGALPPSSPLQSHRTDQVQTGPVENVQRQGATSGAGSSRPQGEHRPTEAGATVAGRVFPGSLHGSNEKPQATSAQDLQAWAEESRKAIVAGGNFSAAYVNGMSMNELRFWMNRQYQGTPPSPASGQNSRPDLHQEAASTQTQQAGGPGARPVAGYSGSGWANGRGRDPGTGNTGQKQEPEKSRSEQETAKSYKLKHITNVLYMGGVAVGGVTYEVAQGSLSLLKGKVKGTITSSNDALSGISTGLYYASTAHAAANALKNPTKDLMRSANAMVGEDYLRGLKSSAARTRYAQFRQETAIDARLVNELKGNGKNIPTSAKALKTRSDEVMAKLREEMSQKYGADMMLRSHSTLNSELNGLRSERDLLLKQLKELKGKPLLTAAERGKLDALQKQLKKTGKEIVSRSNALRGKQKLNYASKRLQDVQKKAQSRAGGRKTVGFFITGLMLRPLADGRDSNTEGLYKAYQLARNPLTRPIFRYGAKVTLWTAKQPLRLVHYIAPKPYEAVSGAVSRAAHAVANAPKNLATRTVRAAARGIAKATPPGLKTGINHVRSAFGRASTGIHNRVYQAHRWFANTRLGHALTSLRIMQNRAMAALRHAWQVVSGVFRKVALALGGYILVSILLLCVPSIIGSITSMVIMSPDSTTSGKIDLSPYCLVYYNEFTRFNEEIAALLEHYQDEDQYDSVELNYSGPVNNAREILSMMAVHLQQSLDMTENPEVKSYISYMFQHSHTYTVYEDKYYCEGCEEVATGETTQQTVVVNGVAVVQEVPVMEPYCPGHIDVQINVNVVAFDEIFGVDNFTSSNTFEGWTQTNIEWCKIIYNMDWNELYEGMELISTGTISGVTVSAYEQEIWDFLMDLIGNEYGAAGLMGNLYCESGLSPTNLQNTYEALLGYDDAAYTAAVDSGSYTEEQFVNDTAGYGLAQWTWYTRKQGLYDYCQSHGTSIGDVSSQLGYLKTELTGSFSSCLNALRNASSAEEASRIAMLQFEAPLDQSDSALAVRQQYAEYYYNKMVYGVAAEGNLTEKQLEVVHIAMNSASYGIAATAGYCQAWAAYVYAKAGLPIDNSSCAYQSGVRYGVSSDFSNVPPGAAVYGYSSSQYGHVGIYVGNGLVYHNIGGVAVDTLSDWVRIYNGFCWGWEGGSDLTTYD